MVTGGEPLLVISDGEVFDYGNVDLGNSEEHMFTVENEGDGVALGINIPPLEGAFANTGGGSCGDTLEPGAACTVVVEFAPERLGLYEEVLTVRYSGSDEAEVTREMNGGGAGESDNLLRNPGGEEGDAGVMPLHWINTGVGDWTTEAECPDLSEPARCIAPLGQGGSPDGVYEITQIPGVDDDWVEAVDSGVMGFSFSGSARNRDGMDDEYRLTVYFCREGQPPPRFLDVWETGWATMSEWEEYGFDQRRAPPNTRSVWVQLACQKSGGQRCDAYFNDLELRAYFPHVE